MARPRRFKSILSDPQDSRDMGASYVPLAHSGASSMPSTHNGSTYAEGGTSVQSAHDGHTSAQSSHNGANSEPENTSYFDESEVDVTLPSGEINNHKRSDGYWRVSLIDDNGTITQERLRVHDIWTLPIGKKVIVPGNELSQPDDDADGLLGGFIGSLASDFSKLPMCYVSWLKVPKKYKDSVYDDIIKKKFHVVDTRMKTFIMRRLGRRWGNIRNGLYNKYYNESLTMEENLRRRPSGVDLDQWIWFIHYNDDPKVQEMRKRNAENRKKQKYTYAGGSKSLPRLKSQEEKLRGRRMSRGEIWTIAHKGKDGNYVNDAAKAIGEQIENIERQNGSSTIISQDDSVARVLGKEHPGRVRGVGHGPTPTQVFGHTTRQCSETSFTHIHDDKMNEIKTELEAEKSKVRELESVVDSERLKRRQLESVVGYISKCFVNQGGDMPPGLAAIVNAMASNEESGPISSGVRPASTTRNI